MTVKRETGKARTLEMKRGRSFTEQQELEREQRRRVTDEYIRCRKERGITQKKLEEVTFISQSVIARLETGATDPRLGTVLRLLLPMGLTLSVVPIDKKKKE